MVSRTVPHVEMVTKALLRTSSLILGGNIYFVFRQIHARPSVPLHPIQGILGMNVRHVVQVASLPHVSSLVLVNALALVLGESIPREYH